MYACILIYISSRVEKRQRTNLMPLVTMPLYFWMESASFSRDPKGLAIASPRPACLPVCVCGLCLT